MIRNETDMLACRSNYCGGARGEAQLLKLQLRGYVVNRGTKADQELANRYYYFCRAQKFTWVEIKPRGNVSDIRVELFGRMQRLDAKGSEEVKALLRRRNSMVYSSIPTITHIPNHMAAYVALRLLRIGEAIQKRAEMHK